MADRSSYKKLTVPVNAKRFPSPPAPLRLFFDLAESGTFPDRDPIFMLRNEYGKHCVYWKIRREGESIPVKSC
ncbi:MAG: hypothetical protein WBV21_06760, partial [Desulfobacterales bacterium]